MDVPGRSVETFLPTWNIPKYFYVFCCVLQVKPDKECFAGVTRWRMGGGEGVTSSCVFTLEIYAGANGRQKLCLTVRFCIGCLLCWRMSAEGGSIDPPIYLLTPIGSVS